MSFDDSEIIKGLEILLDKELVLDYDTNFMIKYKYNCVKINIVRKFSQIDKTIQLHCFGLMLEIPIQVFRVLVQKGKNDLLIYFFDNWRNWHNALNLCPYREWSSWPTGGFITFAILRENSINFKFDYPCNISLEDNYVILTTDKIERYINDDLTIFTEVKRVIKEYIVKKIKEDLLIDCILDAEPFKNNSDTINLTLILNSPYYLNISLAFMENTIHNCEQLDKESYYEDHQTKYRLKVNYSFNNISGCIVFLSKLILLANKIIKYDNATLNSCSVSVKVLHEKIISDTNKFEAVPLMTKAAVKTMIT
jgi:hypothetical protein